jgi:hypothetical protein
MKWARPSHIHCTSFISNPVAILPNKFCMVWFLNLCYPKGG